MLINEVITYLQKRFPDELASEMDFGKTGLIIGNSSLELTKILLALDVTLEVVMEAINCDANLIIVHHPFIFEPLFQIEFESPIGKILELLFKHQITIYVIHTALDVGYGGVNDVLARLLELKGVHGLSAKDQFLRYGSIQPQFLEDFASHVRETFKLGGLRVVGNPHRLIKTVGVIGGSGAHQVDFEAAFLAGVDCYITGEISHHMALKAKADNLALIEVSHSVERFVFVSLENELVEELGLENLVFNSKINPDPFFHR